MTRPRLAALLDRFAAWLFGPIDPIDHDAIDRHLESTAALDDAA